jgi:hypothetical protein
LDRVVKIWILVAATALFVVSCGDSDDTPLGSEFIDDLLGSRPGEVFQDSIPVSGSDTVYTYYRPIDKQNWLEVGVQNNYERLILVKADFSTAGADTLKTVESANLRLRYDALAGYVNIIRVLFYELGTEYTEGDSVVTVDTTAVIPDPDTGALVRQLSEGLLSYDLPPDLVQSWIRGELPHFGIAVVYAEAASDEVMQFESRSYNNPPSIQVNFDGGTTTNYTVTDDCTVVRPLVTTDNLVISDGFVRRVYFEIDLSQVNDSAAVHEALVVFKIVPETVIGGGQTVELYIPASSDPESEGFLDGTKVVSGSLDANSVAVTLPVTNALLGILSDELDNNGFVLRFVTENMEVLQTEFYTSAEAILGPKVYITYSTPARFER